MELREATRYGETQGRRLLRHLANAGLAIFSSCQARTAAAEVGVLEGYVNVLLSSLTAGGWVVRLRRGLYAIMASHTGDVQIHPFAIATHLVTPAAISHWSALHHHGCTQQIPHTVMAFTPQKVVTPSMRATSKRSEAFRHAWEIGGVRYQYITVKPEYFFGIEEVWVSEFFRVPITDKERTVLETCIAPRTFGGIGEALAVLEEHVGDLDLHRLIDYAVRYGKATVGKRLGWALEQAGAPANILAPLEHMPVAGFCILDPTRPRRGPCNKRWKIQENLARSAP